MIKGAFRNFYWGFLLILIDIRLGGLDILPDILGFILFAAALNTLASKSIFFSKAQKFNYPMIILSIFSIYERPMQGGGIQLNPLGLPGVLIAVVSIVLTLLIVYNLFMGIKELAQKQELMDIFNEAEKSWNQFLLLQIAVLLVFVLIFIPFIAVLYILGLLIASIIVTVRIMRFMKNCEETFFQDY